MHRLALLLLLLMACPPAPPAPPPASAASASSTPAVPKPVAVYVDPHSPDRQLEAALAFWAATLGIDPPRIGTAKRIPSFDTLKPEARGGVGSASLDVAGTIAGKRREARILFVRNPNGGWTPYQVIARWQLRAAHPPKELVLTRANQRAHFEWRAAQEVEAWRARNQITDPVVDCRLADLALRSDRALSKVVLDMGESERTFRHLWRRGEDGWQLDRALAPGEAADDFED